MKRTIYKLFIPFDKHMSNIRHLEYNNLKWGNSCLKRWQNFEGMEKKLMKHLSLVTKLHKKGLYLNYFMLKF